jgi:hypothetical protein
LEILGRFVLRSPGVILHTQSLSVLVQRARALANRIENFPELDVRPYDGPFWDLIASQGYAILVRRGLPVLLLKEKLSQSIMCG